METAEAFERGEAARRRGARAKVFDWHKAARLIAERKPEVAAAGLAEDWEWTGGYIYEDGSPTTEHYVHLSSIWATPTLRLGTERVECWIWLDESPGWHAETKWPESALALLRGNEQSEVTE